MVRAVTRAVVMAVVAAGSGDSGSGGGIACGSGGGKGKGSGSGSGGALYICRRPIGPTYVVGPWTHEYRKKKRRRFLKTEKL